MSGRGDCPEAGRGIRSPPRCPGPGRGVYHRRRAGGAGTGAPDPDGLPPQTASGAVRRSHGFRRACRPRAHRRDRVATPRRPSRQWDPRGGRDPTGQARPAAGPHRRDTWPYRRCRLNRSDQDVAGIAPAEPRPAGRAAGHAQAHRTRMGSTTGDDQRRCAALSRLPAGMSAEAECRARARSASMPAGSRRHPSPAEPPMGPARGAGPDRTGAARSGSPSERHLALPALPAQPIRPGRGRDRAGGTDTRHTGRTWASFAWEVVDGLGCGLAGACRRQSRRWAGTRCRYAVPHRHESRRRGHATAGGRGARPEAGRRHSRLSRHPGRAAKPCARQER